MFYLDDCGYCHKAHQALEELQNEHPEYRDIEIEKHEESRESELANQYDYWAVPSFFVDGVKVFEAHIGMTCDDIKSEVEDVLKAAL